MKFLLPLLLVSTFLSAQTNDSKFFRSPLDIPMQLSGNFGELRPNHFHAGFDFKTQQKEGLNVYAVADGYISRIKISTFGYGKAIYITHSNGYTSVYGHLQRGVGEIQDKIEEIQYREKAYEIEAFFKPGEIIVKKGQVIAKSGNTGGSEGPHLHFEFRENSTENVVNPLSLGFEIKDSKQPQVSGLYVYPVGANSVANESKRPLLLNLTLQKDGSYNSEKVLVNGAVGFGISSFDYDDVSYNVNGTYKTEISNNGTSVFGYKFDKMQFEEGRYINALIDYTKYKKTKQRVQKLFMSSPFDWSNVFSNKNNGVITVQPNFTNIGRIEVSDYKGNTTKINIPIEYSNKPAIVPSDELVTNYKIKHKTDCLFEKNDVSVFIPANTFYEDFCINFDVRNGILYLHEDIKPAHGNFIITFDNTYISESERNKTFIANINGTKVNFINTKIDGNSFSCRTKNLGQFKLVKDITPPVITIKKSIENKSINAQKTIVVNISDGLSGVKSYNGYINSEWVLFEYESKLNRLTYQINDKHLIDGNNKLKLFVSDNVGNTAIFETQFLYSKK